MVDIAKIKEMLRELDELTSCRYLVNTPEYKRYQELRIRLINMLEKV